MISCKWIFFVSVSLLPSSARCQSEGAKLFDRVRGWLPSDIEALYVSNFPFRGFPSGVEKPVPEAYARLAGIVTAEIRRENPLAKGIDDIAVDACVHFGRSFRAIEKRDGLGLSGRLQACSFLRASPDQVVQALRPLQEHVAGSSHGTTFYRLDSLVPHFPVLLSAPAEDLLMICNDIQLAEEILERKARNSPSGVFRTMDPLWKYVNVDAPVWGLRRFVRNQRDPTSPLSRAPEVLQHYHDRGAIGMTFTLQSASLAMVTYLTTTKGADINYERSWKLPSSTSFEGGHEVVRMAFNPSQDNNGDFVVRVSLTLLGLVIAY